MSCVEDIDRGYARAMRELVRLANPSVTVGVHGDADDYEDGATVATIARVHEFGHSGKGIPERSFLRSTIDENERRYAAALGDGIERSIMGKSTVYKELELLGLEVKGDVQQKITDIRTPPNAPSTSAAKGSSNPLIDTGHMRQNITHKVDVG